MLVERKNTLENGNLKVTIVGDSFTEFYEDTYLEIICNELNLSVIDHVGFSGGSQYKIYKNFLSQLEKSPDIMICVHTEPSRLYHEKFCMNAYTVERIMKSKTILNRDIYEAADKYYKYLYNDESSKFYYNLAISDMQRLCKIKNIKMINIPAFYNKYVTKFYGLWLSVQPSGLLTHANKTDFLNISNLKNHLTLEGHKVLANDFLPHIKNYCNDGLGANITFLS